MIIKFDSIAKEMLNTRSFEDRRKKVDIYVCKFIGEDGFEYRRKFEYTVGTPMKKVISTIPTSQEI